MKDKNTQISEDPREIYKKFQSNIVRIKENQNNRKIELNIDRWRRINLNFKEAKNIFEKGKRSEKFYNYIEANSHYLKGKNFLENFIKSADSKFLEDSFKFCLEGCKEQSLYNFEKAIELFTLSINTFQSSFAYQQRAFCKKNKDDIEGADQDINAARRIKNSGSLIDKVIIFQDDLTSEKRLDFSVKKYIKHIISKNFDDQIKKISKKLEIQLREPNILNLPDPTKKYNDSFKDSDPNHTLNIIVDGKFQTELEKVGYIIRVDDDEMGDRVGFLDDDEIFLTLSCPDFESVDLDEEWEKRTLKLLLIKKEWVSRFSTDG